MKYINTYEKYKESNIDYDFIIDLSEYEFTDLSLDSNDIDEISSILFSELKNKLNKPDLKLDHVYGDSLDEKSGNIIVEMSENNDNKLTIYLLKQSYKNSSTFYVKKFEDVFPK